MITWIELSLKIEVVYMRASIFSIISNFFIVKKLQMSIVQSSREFEFSSKPWQN